MLADWSMALGDDDAFFQAIVLDAVVRTGLYEKLQLGADNSALDEFDGRLVSPLIACLEYYGWVQKEAGAWHWVGPSHFNDAHRLVMIVKRWLTLSDRLGGTLKTLAEGHVESSGLRESAEHIGRWILRIASPTATQRWLDLAAGSGALGCALAHRVQEVVLCDHPLQTQKWSNQEFPPNVTQLACDVLSDDLPKGFDGIVVSRFIELLSEKDLIPFFKRVRDSLNPHGRLYVIGYFSPKSPWYWHFGLYAALSSARGRSYTASEVIEIARQSGLCGISGEHDEMLGYDALGFGVSKGAGFDDTKDSPYPIRIGEEMLNKI